MSILHEHRPIQIFKFGGTSVATAERIRRVVDLVRAVDGGTQRAVVVSALGGVTDDLIRAIEEALARRETYRDVLQAIRRRHDPSHVAQKMPVKTILSD